VSKPVTGPFTTGPEEVLILRNNANGIEVVLQPSNGSDIIDVANPGGRLFKQRCVPGLVISPGILAGMLTGSLQTALMTIGPNITAIPTPGIDMSPDPIHGLHTALAYTPPVPGSQSIKTTAAFVSVGHNHEICVTNTDPRLACHLMVSRQTTLRDQEGLGTVIEQSDVVGVMKPGHVNMLDHPNMQTQPGDRIVLPWNRVVVLQDRDGNTPQGANPFAGITNEFLGQPVRERCFFAAVRPDAAGLIPLLLLGQNGKGIGVVYKHLPNDPYICIWHSAGGYCGLERGSLPLGATKLHSRKMSTWYPTGASIEKWWAIHLLNDPVETANFCTTFGIEQGQAYARQIEGVLDNYAPLAEAVAAFKC
jgi:hypothetical protein